MGSRVAHAWLAVVLAALAFTPSVALSAWWDTAWPYRRLATIPEQPGSKAAGAVAVVTMPTGGLCAADGSDIRVASGMGKEMPCRVLMMGPGDQVRVAFGIQAGEKNYYVHLGNAKPAATAPELKIERGVLLEMWEYPGGPIATFQQVKDVLDKPGPLIGRDFRDRIFLGHNPFGPQSRIASLWTAWLNFPKEGEYTFCTSSQNSSFLVIDDKVVVDNGGTHGPQRDVSRTGKVQMKAGVHKVLLYHVSGHGDPVAVVAWKTPDERQILPVPADAVTPIIRAAPGPMEKYGPEVSVDFIPEYQGEAFVQDRYFQRYDFKAVTVGHAGNPTYAWDFGDGQTSNAARQQHVYLSPGEYTVTLTAKTTIGELKRTNKIFVSRPWDQITENKTDSLRDHADIVSKYIFASLGPDACANAILLFKRTDDSEGIVKAGDALAAAAKANADLLEQAMPIYADALVAKGQAAKAAEALQKGAEMTDNAAVNSALLVKAGDILLAAEPDGKKALDVYDRVLKKYGTVTISPAIRQARIGIGDVYRIRGDMEKATAAYAAAKDRQDGQEHMLKGDFARHVEEYIRTKDWAGAQEYADRWDEALPMDKLEGFSSLLRARMYLAQNKPAEAVKEVEILIRVNPESNYAAELLMLSADAYGRLNQPDKATAALRRIVDKYPESPLAAEAAKKVGPATKPAK